MTRFLLPSLAVIAALAVGSVAEARSPVRTVKATVIVTNVVPDWNLSVRLAPGTRIQSVSGGHASARRGTIVVKPKASRSGLTVLTRGAAKPSRWRIGATICKVRPGRRSGSTANLSVKCTLPKARPGTDLGAVLGASTSNDGSPTPFGSPQTGAAAPGSMRPSGDGTPTPGPDPSGPTAPAAPYRFAPYVDLAGWPVPDLAAIRAGSGVDHVSLGFVVASTTGDCSPTWGGYVTYPAAGAVAYERTQVQAFKRSGGDVVVAFGGAAGTELALACASTSQLAAAYQSVIDAYAVTHVDFDVEGAALGDSAANTRRAQAVARLQEANPGLVVTYTVPSEITGLDAAGVDAIQNAVDNDVELAAVNLMTMDFGTASDPAGQLGEWTISAGTGLHVQLATIYPDLSATERWRKVGVTPMIGINDVADQIFRLQDAADVTAWATDKGIGMLAMWSLDRDEQCATPVTTAQLSCSGVAQSKWAFAQAFAAFAG